MLASENFFFNKKGQGSVYMQMRPKNLGYSGLIHALGKSFQKQLPCQFHSTWTSQEAVHLDYLKILIFLDPQIQLQTALFSAVGASLKNHAPPTNYIYIWHHA